MSTEDVFEPVEPAPRHSHLHRHVDGDGDYIWHAHPHTKRDVERGVLTDVVGRDGEDHHDPSGHTGRERTLSSGWVEEPYAGAPKPVEPASTVEAAHECWYSFCTECGLYCSTCGRGYSKPIETAGFTVTVWDHARHAAVVAAALGKPVDPTPVEPRQEDYFDPPLGTPERTALHDSLWKGAVALTGSVEEAARLFGQWFDEITRQRNEALAPVPESPAPTIPDEPSEPEEGWMPFDPSPAPVEDEASGWERVGESTNGPSGEAIAVWVNTKDGKIAPVRLAVEQAIAHQFALEQYDILKTRAERAEAEVERMKAALVGHHTALLQARLTGRTVAEEWGRECSLRACRALTEPSTPVQEVENA